MNDRKTCIVKAMQKVFADHDVDGCPLERVCIEAYEAACRAEAEFLDSNFPATPKGEVCVGQIWEDNDKRQRSNPRRGKILRIIGDYAEVQWDTGRTTSIHVKRFRPNSTGYRLVEDVDASTTQAVGTLSTWTNPPRKG